MNWVSFESFCYNTGVAEESVLEEAKAGRAVVVLVPVVPDGNGPVKFTLQYVVYKHKTLYFCCAQMRTIFRPRLVKDSPIKIWKFKPDANPVFHETGAGDRCAGVWSRFTMNLEEKGFATREFASHAAQKRHANALQNCSRRRIVSRIERVVVADEHTGYGSSWTDV